MYIDIGSAQTCTLENGKPGHCIAFRTYCTKTWGFFGPKKVIVNIPKFHWTEFKSHEPNLKSATTPGLV